MFSIPVNIQTKGGLEYAGFIGNEYTTAKKYDNIEFFRDMVRKECHRINMNIRHLLDDKEMVRKYKMDHPEDEGFKLYKELSDKYHILKHYSTRP